MGQFSTAALQNLEETGVDWRDDLRGLQAGALTLDELRSWCLYGADPDRREGWNDYCQTLGSMLE